MERIGNYEATLGNFVEFLRQTSKNLEKSTGEALKESKGCLWLKTLSRYPLFNGFFAFKNNNKNISYLLNEAKDYFNDVPFAFWHCLDGDDISEKTFQERNFHSAGKYSGILLQLDNMNNTIVVDSDYITVKEVSTENDYNQFCDVLNNVFQLSGAIADEFRQLLTPSVTNAPYTNYLGFYKDQPVATLTSFISGKTVGLYCGATLSDFRNKGVFTSLLDKSLNDAKARGCELSVGQLMAKNMAGGVMTRLGYETVCYFTPYLHGANANELEP